MSKFNPAEDRLNFTSFISDADRLNFGEDLDDKFISVYSPLGVDLKRYNRLVFKISTLPYKEELNFPRYLRVVYINEDDKVVAKKLSRAFKNNERDFYVLMEFPLVEVPYIKTELEILIEKKEELPKDRELKLSDVGILNIVMYPGEEDIYV